MIKKFFIGIAVILFIYVLMGWSISVIAEFSAEKIFGLQISGILATLNIVVAFFIIYFTKDKEQAQFSRIFLGSMIIRLFAMLAVIFTIFKFVTVDRFIFIGSLFVLYFLYQIWEVWILNSYHK